MIVCRKSSGLNSLLQTRLRKHEKEEPVEEIFYFCFLKYPEKVCQNYKNNSFTQGEARVLFE